MLIIPSWWCRSLCHAWLVFNFCGALHCINTGGTMDDTEMVQGLCLPQKASKMAGGPTKITGAKIALIQFQLSPPKTDVCCVAFHSVGSGHQCWRWTCGGWGGKDCVYVSVQSSCLLFVTHSDQLPHHLITSQGKGERCVHKIYKLGPRGCLPYFSQGFSQGK